MKTQTTNFARNLASNLAKRSIQGHAATVDQQKQRVYDSIVDLIGNPDNPTPMVRLSDRFITQSDFDLFIKLEGFNPFGSIKDRTALYLLRGTQLAEGQILAEPTAGNTGIALAEL
jgi:cysteine synthase